MQKALVFIIFASLCSCESEFDSTVLNSTEKVALECYISPSDTAITAILTRSIPFTVRKTLFDSLFISDAKVFISDELTEKELIFNKKLFSAYEIPTNQFKIDYGKKYTIRVLLPDGKKIQSTCTVPKKSSIPEPIEILKYIRNPKLIEVQLRWKSEPNQKYFIQKFYYSNNQPQPFPSQLIKSAEFRSDTLTSNFYTYNLDNIDDKRNTIFFSVLDSNLFEYRKTLNINFNNQDDPFSQPINVKSNVEGGLGCFGAYIVTRIDYEL